MPLGDFHGCWEQSLPQLGNGALSALLGRLWKECQHYTEHSRQHQSTIEQPLLDR